jgi:glyoxylate reductase/hydroxypyruvate reductase 2
MHYPELDRRDLVEVVANVEAASALSPARRGAIRVVMTSASRGCSAALADLFPNLGLLVSQGAGQDKLDLAHLAKRAIRVRSVGEAVTDDVADLAMALTHALCRNLVAADAFARHGAWKERRFGLGTSLVGLTMGIAGLGGRIGQAIAQRARASRMQIAALDRPSTHGLDASLHADWEALARASDILVLALPATPDLAHVVDGHILEALGPQGRLVNVGRGSLVDTDALIAALETGMIAGAALDVVEGEPDVPARLAALSNVVLTPHIGAQTWGQRTRGAAIAEAEILDYLQNIAP